MEPSRDPHPIGQVIDGRYEVLECIGEGGMGVVYKARQSSIDRMVAIKMLSSHLARDENWVKRFYNEAKACSRLHHPNTIRMFDFGRTKDGKLFMAMEFLDGQSLRNVVSTHAPLDALRVLKILVQCCASLGEAHNLGIIHRDIKADNIFLIDLPGSRDHVKVLDFGVAKLMMAEDSATQVGVVFGTPQYMSPEQGRGEPLSPRSDLYGIGVLAYEMLTGHVPFTDPNPMTVIQMQLDAPVPPLPTWVPPGVARVVMRALEKNPARRYESAAAMMDDCQQSLSVLLTGPFQAAGGGAPSYPSPPGQPVHPAQLAGRQASAAQMPTMLAPASPSVAVSGNPSLAGGGGRMPAVSAASASAKTMMVDAHGRVAMPAGDQHTRMLPNSEGVVSMAGGHGAGGAPGALHAPHGYAAPPNRAGAGILFWLFCLAAGLAVGVGAYWLVLEFGA